MWRRFWRNFRNWQPYRPGPWNAIGLTAVPVVVAAGEHAARYV